MKKKKFEHRLQNDLFPEMPRSFERKLKQTMDDEGVRTRKRPTAVGVFTGAISVVAAAACLLIVLIGVLGGGRSDRSRAGTSVETPMPSPAVTAAPIAWPWTPEVFTLSGGFEFKNEDQLEVLYTNILRFLMEQGESEPDELWLCAIKSRYVKEDTGNRADGYLGGYYVLAQHAFGENDGPELYCLSEEFEVLWATEGSVSGPNHAANPEEDSYAGAYQGHFIYGMAPTAAHVTRGALVGTNSKEKTDVEFSMETSITKVQERLSGSAHLDAAREYFLITVSAHDWDSVMENPILRFETEAGNVDVNMKTDLPKAMVVLGSQFVSDPVPTLDPHNTPTPMPVWTLAPDPNPTLDPNVTPHPMTDAELVKEVQNKVLQNLYTTRIVDLTGRTCRTGEPDYGTLILRALLVSGVKIPRELWLCAVEPFSENEDTVHSRALILAQYAFEGAAGPELFLYENGRIVWMTQGYEPEGINVVADHERHIAVLFGVSHAYDGRALAMTGSTVSFDNDAPRAFGPVLPLDKVQQIVGEGPNYDYAREFYLCSLYEGAQVTGLSIETDGRAFARTGNAVEWPPFTVPAMAVESGGVVYPGMVTQLVYALDENGIAADGVPLNETLENGLLFMGKKRWTRPLTILTAGDDVTVDKVDVYRVTAGDNAQKAAETVESTGENLPLSVIGDLPAGEYYFCFETYVQGPYVEAIGRYTYRMEYTIFKVTLN